MPIQIIDGFNLGASKPIDSRIVASGSTARDQIKYKYDGLLVVDTNDYKPYIWNVTSGKWTSVSGGSLDVNGVPTEDIYTLGDTTFVGRTTNIKIGGANTKTVDIGDSTNVSNLNVSGVLKVSSNLEASSLNVSGTITGNGSNITNINPGNISTIGGSSGQVLQLTGTPLKPTWTTSTSTSNISIKSTNFTTTVKSYNFGFLEGSNINANLSNIFYQSGIGLEGIFTSNLQTGTIFYLNGIGLSASVAGITDLNVSRAGTFSRSGITDLNVSRAGTFSRVFVTDVNVTNGTFSRVFVTDLNVSRAGTFSRVGITDLNVTNGTFSRAGITDLNVSRAGTFSRVGITDVNVTNGTFSRVFVTDLNVSRAGTFSRAGITDLNVTNGTFSRAGITDVNVSRAGTFSKINVNKVTIDSNGFRAASNESELLDIPTIAAITNSSSTNNTGNGSNSAYINAVQKSTTSNGGSYTARWIRLGFKFNSYTGTTRSSQAVRFAASTCDRIFYCGVGGTTPSNFTGYEAEFFIGSEGNGNSLGRFLSNTGTSENIYAGNGTFYIPAGHLFTIKFEWYSNGSAVSDTSTEGGFAMTVRSFKMGV
jgi:hypothetical protein